MRIGTNLSRQCDEINFVFLSVFKGLTFKKHIGNLNNVAQNNLSPRRSKKLTEKYRKMLSIYISFSAFISYLQAFKYETIFVAGDLNISLLDPEGDSNNCFDLRDTYNLSNVMKSPTCLSQPKVHFFMFYS